MSFFRRALFAGPRGAMQSGSGPAELFVVDKLGEGALVPTTPLYKQPTFASAKGD